MKTYEKLQNLRNTHKYENHVEKIWKIYEPVRDMALLNQENMASARASG